MIKELRITNLILVEFSQVEFQHQFNVLTGESGSGKSAILSALNLISGERAEIGSVRKGTSKGCVEASFDIEGNLNIKTILENAGIDHEEGEDLLIKRELFTAGKSRAFINNQMAQLNILKKITSNLFEFVSQHANQKLTEIDQHRKYVDTYGELQEKISDFTTNWVEELTLQKKIQELIEGDAKRLREIEVCRMELEELENAQLKEGEEEELFAEYTLLMNSEELTAKVHQVTETLSGENQAIIPVLNSIRKTLEDLTKLDTSLGETQQSFNNAIIELQEINTTLKHYGTNIEYHPEKAQKINERLTLINKLKKKYGETIEKIDAYHEETIKKFEQLNNYDNEIELLKQKLEEIHQMSDRKAKEITELRCKYAAELEKKVTTLLQTFNMKKAEFEIDITKQKRTRSGDDRIEFFLIPNIGENRIPIKECASGGELSRVMLAIHILLSDKEKIPTIVFDEIDSNIGGETAHLIGEKLCEISKQKQVLCITHFPQVAQHAHRHFQITKIESHERTITLIKKLNQEEKQRELKRMLGGELDLLSQII